MGTCMDLLHCLESDVVINIFTCLDDPSDLIHVGAVSRSWRHFVVENGLCKQMCLEMFPQLSRVDSVVELNKQVKEDRLEAGTSSNWMEWESKVREHNVFAFLARRATSFAAGNCIFEAVSASSTDNYPEESIAYTLEPKDIVANRASYWSSKGQRDNKIPETLIYKLVSKLCIITEISIRPFQAFFQLDLPIYSAKAVRFRMGHAKSPEDLESNSVKEPCHDDKFVWTYASQEFPMDQLNVLQKFKLPKPVLFVGGYLQIELLGRVQRQEMDMLYYICISHVNVSGYSLAAELDAEIIDRSGKIVLKRDLKAETYQAKPPEKHHSSRDDNLERRVRNLEQIVLMLRRNQFMRGLNEGGDDESDEELVL